MNIKKHFKGIKNQPNMDGVFLVTVFVLLTIGLVMLFSASYANALYYHGDSMYFIKSQAVFAAVGIALMLGISLIDYHILKKLTLPIFAVAFLLLIIVLFMPSEKGITRWINLGFMQFQPSEVMKFAIILLFALLISNNYSKMGTFTYGVLMLIIPLGAVCVLMLLQPHLSGLILIGAIAATMMFVGGTKYRWFALLVAAAVLAVAAIIIFKGVGYAMGRINGWLDPMSDPSDTTFQTYQSLLSIGSGGLMGLGFGNSRQKYLYLPEPQNDFIFAIVCEEIGFIGAILIIGLFILFIFRGFAIATKAKDKFGMLVAVGITAQIGLQALLNIGVVSNAIPNTGISLPFFSYGGTALVMQLCEIGVLLNISRQAILEKE